MARQAAEPNAAQLPSSSGTLVALLENRAKEVGVATFHKGHLELCLTQIIESSRTYTHVMSFLSLLEPDALLVVASPQAASSGLYAATAARYKQIPEARQHFDDTKALQLLERAQLNEVGKLDLDGLTASHYLALGAAGALLRYLEEEQKVLVASHSLRISVSQPSHYLQVDASAAAALELVQPLGWQILTSGMDAGRTPNTLLRLLNHCKTTAGLRLLRANLLQPPSHLPTTQGRQHAVTELLQQQSNMLEDLATALKAVPKDLDSIYGTLFLRPLAHCVPLSTASTATLTRRLSGLLQGALQLKELLQTLPAIADALHPAQSLLLTTIRSNCGSQDFTDILQNVHLVLEEEAQTSKLTFVNRTQQCFAVRPGVDTLLDLARQAFQQTTDQIHQLAQEYSQQPGLEGMKTKYTTRSSFCFVLPKLRRSDGHVAPAATPQLPDGFILLDDRPKTSILCTTAELSALNVRLKDSEHDCLLLSVQVLEGLLERMKVAAPLLQRLFDNIALADMLAALAKVAALQDPPWVCPEVTASGPLVIAEGRHPLTERAVSHFHAFQSNDTYLADCSSLLLVGGPNMAGKTTYIKQVALITLLAHVGSYVPASLASIPLRSKLLVHCDTGDCQEPGASAFMREMLSIAHILESVDDRSLVIIDEVGRSTSTTDGLAISWAVAEALLETGAFTLFASHYPALRLLPNLHPAAACHMFQVSASEAGTLQYTWKLQAATDGGTDQHYGLSLAQSLRFPDQVIATAKRTVEQLEQHSASRKAVEFSAHTTAQVTAQSEALELAHKVECVLAEAALHRSRSDAAAAEIQTPSSVMLQQAAARLGALQKTAKKTLEALVLHGVKPGHARSV